MDTKGLSIAIMQPYFFPYLGYFQLINAVDSFVIYDDVNYIVRGWVNRNRILVNGSEFMVSLPLKKARATKKINTIELVNDGKWTEKFMRTIEMAYAKAPYFAQSHELIQNIFNSGEVNLAAFLHQQLKLITSYLGIKTSIISTSTQYHNQHLRRDDRLIDIVKQENASVYINALGGEKLYSKEYFAQQNTELLFLEPVLPTYPQHKSEKFISGLSIIDVMMHNTPEQIRGMLRQFNLK